jgi:ATP synthase protein I
MRALRGNDFRRFGELSTVALTLPSSIAIGLFMGYFLDKWLGTDPWLLLLFLVFGIASGLLSLFRGLRKLERAAREGDAGRQGAPPSGEAGRGENDRD